jgi:hypothetical protein
MTATPAFQASWTPAGTTAIPAFLSRFLAANAQAGKGQFATVDPATGYAALNDGTVPNQVAAGQPDYSELSDVSTVAGKAEVRLSERWFYGLAASTISADGFTDADFGVPFYIATENTLGKKSNDTGSNRSLGGLVFGINTIDGTPYAWTGIVAHLLARATRVTTDFEAAGHSFADAAANTATAERAISRTKQHGVVTAVQFTGAAVAADGTDYDVITVSKRDGAGGAAVVIATYDTRAPTTGQGAITAFVPANFLLSVVAGALNLLETDIITIAAAKNGAGKVLTGTVRVIQKVL